MGPISYERCILSLLLEPISYERYNHYYISYERYIIIIIGAVRAHDAASETQLLSARTRQRRPLGAAPAHARPRTHWRSHRPAAPGTSRHRAPVTPHVSRRGAISSFTRHLHTPPAWQPRSPRGATAWSRGLCRTSSSLRRVLLQTNKLKLHMIFYDFQNGVADHRAKVPVDTVG